MQTSNFSDYYKKLNPEQREAVDAIEGPVMVIAGPGTGKTQILTLRVANILLKTQVSPENILALTFSESAAFQMRQRLTEIIGTPGFRVEISTFHSFGNNIIQNFPEEFENLLSSESITEAEQIEQIEGIIIESDLKLLKPWGDPLFYVRDALGAINDLKKESVAPIDLEKAVIKRRKNFDNIEDLYHEKGKYKGEMKGKYQDELKSINKLEEFVSIYKAYQNFLLENKKYDFNDMLIEVIKVFEKNKSLLLQIQEKYQYILVDEHQDTNSSQNRLVELIAGFYEVPNLFVVGDEKQAIYRFQGASLENFLYFKKKYPTARLVNLSQNYRSHQTILDASSSFISHNVSANILKKVDLIAAKEKTPENIKLAVLEDYYGEYEFITRQVKSLLDKGIDPKEIAILGRRNVDLGELSDFLKRSDIPYVIDADMDALSDLWICKLLFILEAVNDFGNEAKLGKILPMDVFKFEPVDIFKLINYSRKEDKSLYEILDNLKDVGLKLQNPKQIKNFYKTFKGWASLSKNIPLDDLFIKVLNESGIKINILKLPERNEILGKLIALFEEVKVRLYKNPEYSLGDFLKRIELLRKHKLSLEVKSKLVNQNAVKLLTAHKSKGLEFDYVFIFQCFDGRWGKARKRAKLIKLPWEELGENIKSEAQFEEIEDERRLFYVGLTRARKDVILTYSKLSESGKEQLPSPFIEEIQNTLIDEIDTTEFNSGFAISKEVIFEPRKNEFKLDTEFDYLKSLFLEKGLSITGFQNFLECPWKYFFVNLISMPDIKSKFQLYGTAIHYSLDNLIKRRKIEKDPKLFLIKSFEKILKEQSLNISDKKEFLEKGKLALDGFYDKVFVNFPDSIQSEVSVRGIKFSENLILNGRIDMLEEIEKNKFRIHDFKTGKPKRKTEVDGSKADSKYNYLRQLIFYKLILEKFKGGIFKVTEGVIDFVEPDDKGRFSSVVFDLNEGDEAQVLQEFESVASQIASLSFWEERCGVKDCEWCALREMMG